MQRNAWTGQTWMVNGRKGSACVCSWSVDLSWFLKWSYSVLEMSICKIFCRSCRQYFACGSVQWISISISAELSCHLCSFLHDVWILPLLCKASQHLQASELHSYPKLLYRKSLQAKFLGSKWYWGLLLACVASGIWLVRSWIRLFKVKVSKGIAATILWLPPPWLIWNNEIVSYLNENK